MPSQPRMTGACAVTTTTSVSGTNTASLNLHNDVTSDQRAKPRADSYNNLVNLKTPTQTDKKKRHALIILVLVSTCMFVCWMPALVISITFSFFPAVLDTLPPLLTPFSMALAMLNSLMNVIIYIIKDKSFRKRFIKIIRRN